jgi:hypothetical protein
MLCTAEVWLACISKKVNKTMIMLRFKKLELTLEISTMEMNQLKAEPKLNTEIKLNLKTTLNIQANGK